MDLDSLPKDDLERLRAYRVARNAEEERVLVEALMEKKELTEREKRMVAYSPFGTGITQRC